MTKANAPITPKKLFLGSPLGIISLFLITIEIISIPIMLHNATISYCFPNNGGLCNEGMEDVVSKALGGGLCLSSFGLIIGIFGLINDEKKIYSILSLILLGLFLLYFFWVM